MIKLIKVDAIASTNTFLKEAVRSKTITQPTCVWTENQLKGKGQMGSSWISEKGKNLTFSLFFPVGEHISRTPFVINMLTTVSIYSVLEKYNLPNLKIKWPNDILSANKKIGGVLIENRYKNDIICGTVIGIGLNVNQKDFSLLPKASSISNLIQHTLSLEVLLIEVLNVLEKTFLTYNKIDFFEIKKEFEGLLFRNNKPSTFSKKEAVFFSGIIQGVTNDGKLKILEEGGVLETYNLKEIQLKY